MIEMSTKIAQRRCASRALVFILTLSMTIAGMLGYFTEEAEAKAETVTVKYGKDLWYGTEFNGYTSLKWVTHINGEGIDLDDIESVTRSYAYCVQPLVFAPPAGTYPVTVVDDDDSGRIAKMRKLIYYLPGAYGYTKVTKKRWFSGESTNDAYVLGHLGLSWIYEKYDNSYVVWGGAPSSMKNKVKDMVDDLSNLEDPPEDFEVFWVKVPGKQDIFGAFYHTEYGSTKVVKTSSMPQHTSGNESYSLEGAEYTVYADEKFESIANTADGNPAVLITDKDGNTDEIKIETGDYYVKETKAPEGYAIDTKARHVSVKKDKTTTLNLSDVPRHSRIKELLHKLDKDKKKGKSQGDASLAGAVYEFSYYDGQYASVAAAEASGKPKATWYFETGANGVISGSSPKLAGSYTSSELYKDSDGNVIFLLGSYVIKEVKAPTGYLINNEKIIANIAEDDSEGVLVATYDENLSSDDEVMRGGVKISKIDNDLDEAYSQGDASLEGAEFTIYNKSKESVIVGGKEIANGAAALVIRTNDKGIASSAADALPYGTYSIKETKAPTGYLPNGSWTETFTVRENGKIVDLSAKVVREAVVRGGVQIVKRDKELMKSEALGAASLEGVVMTIRNVSGHDVVVRKDIGSSTDTVNWTALGSKQSLFEDGSIKRVANGEDLGQITTHWNEEKQAYTAETLPDDLPYGSYTIRETKTNASYQRTDKEEHRFEIRENKLLHSYDGAAGDALSFDNYVYRSDVQGTKIGIGDSRRFSNVPFKITSLSNNETHVVVTDKNGFFSTRDRRTADELDEEEGKDNQRQINPFDDLLEAASIQKADIEVRADDIKMGVWFGTGEFESKAEHDPTVGALPYDSYIIEELPCEENEGYSMQKFFFIVDEKSRTGLIDLETITNDVPALETEASAGGESRDVVPTGDIELTDTIHYEGLKRGEVYTVKGTLMDKVSGEEMTDANGEVITAETEFKPWLSKGKTKVVFNFDASKMEGADTVVFERLYDAEGHIIAKHEDWESESQTITWKSAEIPEVPVITETPDEPEEPEEPEEPDKPRSPKTGDDFSLNLLYCLLAMAVSAEGLLLTKKRRNDRLN